MARIDRLWIRGILKHGISITLSRIVHIWVIQEVLNPKQDLTSKLTEAENRRVIRGRACLIVIAGFHDFSSSKMERQTVPDGYTLGWKSGGVNLPIKGASVRCPKCLVDLRHLGGFDG